MENNKTITTHSPEETVKVASALAKKLKKRDFIALVGELGVGKTMFVKGLAKGLGVKEHIYVNSPSFVIVKEYRGKTDLYHFDIYRLDLKHFCETLDYERYFYGNGVTVVEWADKITEILPEEYLEITLEYGQKPDERKMSFRAAGEKYKSIIKELK
ncbi:MAG: tRNA (adenosine(37)-N6)-threonylcarbamoyltransferase complex ATPase subunit type 1 TsaE [Candidatus Omnitrophica bacterium]|nr:tRNA (adenosine(37)-N6)-threonylcarbamoyltransferase complex ATPase subunit type 1 TsaE [Candidatus Omnitrophota bacterium]